MPCGHCRWSPARPTSPAVPPSANDGRLRRPLLATGEGPERATFHPERAKAQGSLALASPLLLNDAAWVPLRLRCQPPSWDRAPLPRLR